MSNVTYTFKRVETKYRMNSAQYTALMEAIKDHIQPDEFGSSTIRNIYYDTPDYHLTRRSLESPVYKEKLRIRSYAQADETSKVFVELKKKYKGIVYKRRIGMPLDEAMAFCAGEANVSGQIADEIGYFLGLYGGIKPAFFLSYDRKAFYDIDNPSLRLTFDSNIMWREDNVDLTAPVGGNCLLDCNETLLEIKCGGAMPLWLTNVMTENHIFKAKFTKIGNAYLQKLELEYQGRENIA